MAKETELKNRINRLSFKRISIKDNNEFLNSIKKNMEISNMLLNQILNCLNYVWYYKKTEVRNELIKAYSSEDKLVRNDKFPNGVSVTKYLKDKIYEGEIYKNNVAKYHSEIMNSIPRESLNEKISVEIRMDKDTFQKIGSFPFDKESCFGENKSNANFREKVYNIPNTFVLICKVDNKVISRTLGKYHPDKNAVEYNNTKAENRHTILVSSLKRKAAEIILKDKNIKKISGCYTIDGMKNFLLENRMYNDGDMELFKKDEE